MIQPVHVERINDRIADQMVDIPVPPVMEEIVAAVQEVTRLVTQERVQRRTAEHLVDVPVNPIWEEAVKVVVRLVPRERVQHRPILQMMQEIVGTPWHACNGSTSKLWRCFFHK